MVRRIVHRRSGIATMKLSSFVECPEHNGFGANNLTLRNRRRLTPVTDLLLFGRLQNAQLAVGRMRAGCVLLHSHGRMLWKAVRNGGKWAVCGRPSVGKGFLALSFPLVEAAMCSAFDCGFVMRRWP